MTAGTTIDDVVCLGCACLCDDIRVTRSGDRVGSAEHACDLGREWFAALAPPVGPACEVDGRPTSMEDACDRAAELLLAARAPLVCGLAGAATDAQRAAVGIADRLGACVDWTVSPTDAAPVVAYQTHGAVTASLGEVAQRADLVIFWRCDPATTHARHFERYSLQPASRWLPRGRADRTVVSIGSHASETSRRADATLALDPGADDEAINLLHALFEGIDPSANNATGVSQDDWKTLAEQVRHARYAVIFYGRELAQQGHAALAALTRFAQAAQDHTRLVTAPLGAQGNSVGAENVLTWQTGYPMAVSFARGWPEYGPDEHAAHALLGRGEADAALVVSEESLQGLPDRARQRLRSIPTVALTSGDASRLAPEVLFRVAPLGGTPGGDVYRSDGVALPLRHRLVDGAATAASVVGAIERSIAARAVTTVPTPP